jgi:putative solute:sodium symporter small subunit
MLVSKAPLKAVAFCNLDVNSGFMELTRRHKEYWTKTLVMTAILLAIWFVVTFVVAYMARDLSFNFFGWPFSFYMGAQGALLVYCCIIAFYAYYMNRLDKQYGVDEVTDDDVDEGSV